LFIFKLLLLLRWFSVRAKRCDAYCAPAADVEQPHLPRDLTTGPQVAVARLVVLNLQTCKQASKQAGRQAGGQAVTITTAAVEQEIFLSISALRH
jgi:hypothetical protein